MTLITTPMKLKKNQFGATEINVIADHALTEQEAADLFKRVAAGFEQKAEAEKANEMLGVETRCMMGVQNGTERGKVFTADDLHDISINNLPGHNDTTVCKDCEVEIDFDGWKTEPAARSYIDKAADVTEDSEWYIEGVLIDGVLHILEEHSIEYAGC